MPINTGNSSWCEVYAGSAAIEEIYAGSNLVWSKGPSLKLTLDTSKVTEDLSNYYIRLEISRIDGLWEILDVYLYKEDADFHFSNNRFIYSDVSDGDEICFWVDTDDEVEDWEDYQLPVELNIEGETITIHGQTKVALVMTDRPSDTSLILTLDMSEVTNDLTSHYVVLRVNGDPVDEMIYLNEGEGDDYFSNNQFIYSNISDGDEVSIVLVSDSRYLNGLFDYNGDDTDTIPVTINGETSVTLRITDRYVDNSIEIPYTSINEAFGTIFYDDHTAKLTVTIEMFYVDGHGSYTETYTYTGEDYSSENDIIFGSANVNISEAIYPDDATYSISYVDMSSLEGSGGVLDTGSISFTEPENCHFVGTFD